MLGRIPLLVLPAIILSLSIAACGSDGEAGSSPGPAAQAPVAAPAPPVVSSPATSVSAPASEGTVVKVDLEDPSGSGAYRFDPGDLAFNVGQIVIFDLTSEAEFHTFTVDDLGIDEAVGAEETVRFTFTFDKAGTFRLICIPHQGLGMHGEILVN